MRKLFFGMCLLALCTSVAAASEKISSQWKCDGKPGDEKSMMVGDHEGHTYHISQGKCTAEKGAMGEAKDKDGAWTQFDDINGTSLQDHGVFIVTMSTGDKIYYHYRGQQTLKDGKTESGTNTWTLQGGTGKFKVVKGEGSCKGTGNPDGSSVWTCEGTYETGK